MPRLVVLAFALASLLAAAPGEAAARSRAPRKAGAHGRQAAPREVSLARARALLASVKRDPAKRRYRHNWEKAIRALTRAARGKDAPAALLEAGRARYALYRFSANEADREAALTLAARAARAGSREGKALAAAIRREAGDEPRPERSRPRRLASGGTSRPRAVAVSRASSGAAPVSLAAIPAAAPVTRQSASAEDEAPDPVLEEAVTDLQEAAPGSSAPGAGAGPEGPARISEVKTWSNADYTRVAVYLSRPVGFEKQELEAGDDRPRRLALDLRPALLDGRLLARPVGDAQVERVRAAQRDADTVRVVLDLAGSDAYQLFRLADPPRLIVDVGTREAQRAAQAAALAPSGGPARAEPAAPPSGRAPEAEEGSALTRPVRRVIVDAGHGGHDAGAIGPHGIREKDVTLAMARRLARRLEAAGFQVVLTRRDDRYLPLEERTAIANTARGDLFVSLHANAHPRRDRRGVETYYLNVTDDRYAARLAARENGLLSDEEAPDRQVTRILSDLDARASSGSSQRLARLVQRELTGGIRSRVGEVRDLGVKSAVFYVLLGARMPAVLVETSFISNRAEERRLASRSFQEEVAGDVARAVERFAGQGARVAAR